MTWSVLNLQNSANTFISGLSEGAYVCKARVENINGSLTNCLGQISVQVVGADVVIPPSPASTPTPSPQPNPSGASKGVESLNESAEMKLKNQNTNS
jgi:hypothetical protein